MDVALTVGGSFLSGFLQVLFDRMASPEFLNLFRERKQDSQLLKKLKTSLLVIRAVLDDAENKQTRNFAVKEWLDEIQETVYQTDDLLDQINTEALRIKVESQYQNGKIQVSSITETSLLSNAFFAEIMPEIENMVARLELFIQHISPLGLQIGEVKKESFRLPSTSLVGETAVYGRDVDKEKMINMLLSENLNEDTIGVIPIVGLGGIGKTTLAQLVYNDERVKAHFDVQGWVCISEEYNAVRITKELLRELNIVSLDSSENFNALQVVLQLGVTEKKFLVVLDDIWNRDYNDWDKLRVPLRSGLRGSKILVTTRDENIALMMCSGPIHHLELISEEDCWALFEKHALENRDGDAYQDLAEVGKKIVKKCEGLPLAVKTVAGLLRSKRTVKEWEGILRSEVWNQTTNQNGILPALRLSYIHLPSHLKRCFIYCAVFHKGYKFREEEVIQLWLANDLLEHYGDNQRLEDVGAEYFHELRLRSLFQQSFGNLFCMHDIVNDLASSLRGKYCLRLEDNQRGHGAIDVVRDFSYLADYFDSFKKLQLLSAAKNLRTFLPLRKTSKGESRIFGLSKKLLHDVLPAFKFLRVLSLSGYRILMLPGSIRNLKQLRLLDLSFTNIRKLPDWICTLYNIQTLLLSNCYKLEDLPVDMEKLINLRYLDIHGTQLKKMLIHIGRLRSLQVLTTSIVGKGSGSTIEELGKLPNLRGDLIISGLENVLNGKDASMANVKGKKSLERISLKWRGDTNDSRVAKDVLDNLQPHSSLKHLEIDGYCGTSFPDWLGNCCFYVVTISLRNCEHSFCLPALGQLVSLKFLTISGLNKLLEINKEFYGDGIATKPFQSLRVLKFEKLSEWRHWYIPDSELFSSLEELYIINCPKLIEFPKKLLSLQKFEISGCNQLVLSDGRLSVLSTANAHLVQQLPSLRKLVLSSLKHVKDLSLEINKLTSLKDLEIRYCDNLRSIYPLPDINRLVIVDCASLLPIPMSVLPPTVKTLQYWSCCNLEMETESCQEFLEFLKLYKCSSIKRLSLGLFPRLQRLHIDNCKNIEVVSVPRGNQNIISLKSLKIWDCDNLLYFLKGGLFAPNLSDLSLQYCKKLKSLPEGMQSLLPCLRYLEINNCPEIESFPEGGLPSSLETLYISDCEKLVTSWREWDLQRLPFLRVCEINGTTEEELLREHWVLPCTLQILSFRRHKNLKMLNCLGLRHLTSLESLSLIDCPLIQSLPQDGLPTSLSRLYVKKCPLLKQRLEWQKGQDWPKVDYIQCVIVDDEPIP